METDVWERTPAMSALLSTSMPTPCLGGGHHGYCVPSWENMIFLNESCKLGGNPLALKAGKSIKNVFVHQMRGRLGPLVSIRMVPFLPTPREEQTLRNLCGQGWALWAPGLPCPVSWIRFPLTQAQPSPHPFQRPVEIPRTSLLLPQGDLGQISPGQTQLTVRQQEG